MKNTISQLRKRHKITQEELANEVGVTRQTITSIETGKYIASLPLAFKIAKFFDMSIEEIFSIEEDD
ncbi:transcriptional regulator [Jeotgalibaca sp. PTS2502]|uniref:helix-turn-helix transcriptional regulator n=1 Tax=Jeotgalibaca sp. PTS2502 TaxID=1903686 RepID=UPI0009736954|nr:helix-turn-helix transcriptional regulator [Jeotgalibaca sp. PTS2502]APZ49773.1 transcriptional regulator [Jeotgalibaca sp. PTS2502]